MERMRTCHQNWVKANKYFYIREIRCQAESGVFGAALVRSRKREIWLLGKVGSKSQVSTKPEVMRFPCDL